MTKFSKLSRSAVQQAIRTQQPKAHSADQRLVDMKAVPTASRRNRNDQNTALIQSIAANYGQLEKAIIKAYKQRKADEKAEGWKPRDTQEIVAAIPLSVFDAIEAIVTARNLIESNTKRLAELQRETDKRQLRQDQERAHYLAIISGTVKGFSNDLLAEFGELSPQQAQIRMQRLNPQPLLRPSKLRTESKVKTFKRFAGDGSRLKS